MCISINPASTARLASAGTDLNGIFVYSAVSNRLEQPFGAPGLRPEYLAARQRTTPLVATDSKGFDVCLSETG